MRLLVLGGTGFVGRHVVDAALARGHELTLFDRRRTDPALFPHVERLAGDRERDLGALRERSWDAVVDLSGFTPTAVRASARLLATAVRQYTFVSSVSAYADLSRPGVDERAHLLADAEGYGARKAAAERTLAVAFPGRVLRVRPGVLIGPWDRSGRCAFWVRRVAAGGEVLVPGPPDRRLQLLDVRDLAGWLVRMAADGAEGVFNAVGNAGRLTARDLVETCRAVSGSDASFTWVDPRFLVASGVRPWLDVPLWPDRNHAGFFEVDGSAAVQAGLGCRPLEATVRDVLAWERAHPHEAGSRGLVREREAELLRAWRRARLGEPQFSIESLELGHARQDRLDVHPSDPEQPVG